MQNSSRSWARMAAFLMVIAACGGGGEATTTAAPTDGTTTTIAPPETTGTTAAVEPIVFAASLPLTGEFAIAGTKHQDGYQFCVDEINARGGLLDRPVQLLVEDNRSDSEVAVTQYERFITVDGVDILFGTFSSLLTFPTSAVAEQNGMVYPVPSGGALRIWERGFQNIFYFQQAPAEFTATTVMNMLQFYQEQGIVPALPTTAAVVFGDDFFAGAIANGYIGGEVALPDGTVVADLAPGALAEAGVELVMQEDYPAGFTDWLTLANTIAGSEAEFLSISTASPDEAISLIRALQTVGYQPQFVYASQGAQSEFQESLGGAAEGVAIHTVWHPSIEFEGMLGGETYTNAQFIEGFTAAFDRPPDEDEAIPFAVCEGMEQAILGAETTDNAVLSQWLRDRTADDPVRTVMGDFNWDERGLPVGRDFLVNQWQDGELAFVFPVGDFPGTTDMVYPKPEW